MESTSKHLPRMLIAYLLVMGVGAAAFVVWDFPHKCGNELKFPLSSFPTDRGLFVLAFAAGMTGSFVHGAQSLATYLGNADFKPSWAAWYFLRPWIGGVFGLSIYVAIRAGVIGGAASGDVNPYGIVALGLLGGWFSKTTSDKMQGVFETLFKTDADKSRKHKLSSEQPTIDKIDPSPVPPDKNQITVSGRNFEDGAMVLIDEQPLDTKFISNSLLEVSLTKLEPRPAKDASVRVKVRNPKGQDRLSAAAELKFG